VKCRLADPRQERHSVSFAPRTHTHPPTLIGIHEQQSTVAHCVSKTSASSLLFRERTHRHSYIFGVVKQQSTVALWCCWGRREQTSRFRAYIFFDMWFDGSESRQRTFPYLGFSCGGVGFRYTPPHKIAMVLDPFIDHRRPRRLCGLTVAGCRTTTL
jgi:hypothetical protein